MKSAKIAAAVLIILITLVFLNSFFISNLANKFAEKLEKIDLGSEDFAYEELKALKNEFETRRIWITLTVSHDDISSIEEAFSDIIGAALAKERSEMIITKSRLENALRHLGRLSAINIDSIL